MCEKQSLPSVFIHYPVLLGLCKRFEDMKFFLGHVYCLADRRMDIVYCPETIQYFRYYTIKSRLPLMDTIYYATLQY